jgi:hypothetical protein
MGSDDSSERVVRPRQAQGKAKIQRVPRPNRTKGTWYVSFETPEKRVKTRTTQPFQNEHDAKAFAKARLDDSLNVAAGTLNPHLPKRTIASAQLFDWLNEADNRGASLRWRP